MSKLDDLVVLAEQRASQKRDAIEHEQLAMMRRDRLEVSWDNIYVPFPITGQPVDYDKWADNIMSFVEVAIQENAADTFRNAKPATSVDRAAMSLIHAGLRGGRQDVVKRLEKMFRRIREWGAVFNKTDLFWKTMNSESQVHNLKVVG